MASISKVSGRALRSPVRTTDSWQVPITFRMVAIWAMRSG
jgi:hypothetical protein